VSVENKKWNMCVRQVILLPAWSFLWCCIFDQAVRGTLTSCSLLSSCSSFRDSTYADHDPLGHTENHDDTADLNGIDKIFEGIEPASSLWLVFSLFAACLDCPAPVFCCMPARYTQKCIILTLIPFQGYLDKYNYIMCSRMVPFIMKQKTAMCADMLLV